MLITTSQPTSQIVAAAFFAVKCRCGYGHDAFSATEADARLEIKARHDCGEALTLTPYTCREHQVIGKCKECAR